MKEEWNLVEKAVKAMEDKKAEEIKILDLEGVTMVADYFIIATGNSTTQVKAISDNINEELGRPLRKEGYNDANWVLMDYGYIVIHIFQQEMRDFYDLERLWGNAKQVTVNA